MITTKKELKYSPLLGEKKFNDKAKKILPVLNHHLIFH
jgi:hypothetical protein